MSEPRSTLARFAHLSHEPDPAIGWELAKKAWHEHGIVCLNPEAHEVKIGWVAARIAKNLGEQCFGKRNIPNDQRISKP